MAEQQLRTAEVQPGRAVQWKVGHEQLRFSTPVRKVCWVCLAGARDFRSPEQSVADSAWFF